MSTLAEEKRTDEASYTSFMRLTQDTSREVELIMLDPGMVTILNKEDRISFIKLVMYITLRKPTECGRLMLQLAQYNNKRKIDKKVQ
jgi:predicted unusual protein kinase regulating ubiquinone biosynthesis (AarF/ABC1/UbiB family)